jgi:ABC-type enterochelin transport system substrate-binding protein
MKFTYVISALMAILLTACASTQQTADTTSSTAVQSSKHMPYHGTIMAIDMSANTVTIQTDSGTMTMAVNENTKFKYPGGSLSLSDFKVGEEVTGAFMMDDSGKMIALAMKPYSSKQ